MANSHYVPMLTLRKFADKLCLFNVRTGQYKENVKIENNTLDLSHFKNEIFYQLFDYIIREYDKFKV